LDLEEENRKKRKEASLTTEEWLTFFFFPTQAFTRFNSDAFNKTEQKRFKEFGFDKKRKQASEAKFFGILFYINLILFIIVLLNK